MFCYHNALQGGLSDDPAASFDRVVYGSSSSLTTRVPAASVNIWPENSTDRVIAIGHTDGTVRLIHRHYSCSGQ
ncbi:hypothetical protein Q1695_011653 [Nippostrongylus brasiliensis]|nr:hypothetical protein Q1695_011653 [Nippostrongylus brasiliensis]